MISTSDGLVNTWNYRNELTQSVEGGVTVTYGYDHTGQRVKKTEGSNTTYYPFGHYEVKNGDVIKHIYANDMLVATIDDGTVTHVHVDHLGSSNVMSDSVGGVAQLLTYYPFGGTETDTQYGGTDQTKRFGNYDFDEETGLNYAGARYQSGTEGRFTSQDPVAHEIGNWGSLESRAEVSGLAYLTNPQSHNTYSYALNNPVIYTDKDGEFVKLAGVGIKVAFKSLRNLAKTGKMDLRNTIKQEGLDIADNISTLADGQLTFDDAIAVFDLASPVSVDDAKDIGKATKNGIVYLRTDKTGSIEKPYIGQAKSPERYDARQGEHAANHPNSDFEFQIIDRGVPGRHPSDLDRREQSYIDQLGGPTNRSNPDGGTSNKRNVIKKEDD